MAMTDSARGVYAQALWDVYRVLGFDTDGDEHPGALIGGMGPEGFAGVIVDAATSFREDYDNALEELWKEGEAKERAVIVDYLRHRIDSHIDEGWRTCLSMYADQIEKGRHRE